MNSLDFTQTGGFPFDQGILAFLQDNINLASKSVAWGGNFSIVSGCDIAGGNAGNGFVAVNGEIMPFVGGAIDTKVIIVETTTSLLYEDNVSRPVQKVHFATFGDDGVTNYLWADFKRNTSEGVLARLERLERVAAPFLASGKGGMVLWNRPALEIPAGWAEVVDWRGRMPVGVNPDDIDFNVVGKTGGAKTHTNTISEMAPHNHDVNNANSANGAGKFTTGGDSSEGGTLSTNSKGGGTPYSILNPYRTVYFIEYTGN